MKTANVLKPSSTVESAIRILEEQEGKYVCVTDENDVLVGLFTQGDLRRFLLIGGTPGDNVCLAMNRKPITFETREDAITAAKSKMLPVYPIVDGDGKLLDCYCPGDPAYEVMGTKPLRGVPLVVMAGGRGTRLYPYTKVLPKALVPIGEKTIIERVIDQFTQWGCKDVYLIINYKGRMIKSYFEYLDIDYNVHFIEEEEFLGTGGGLSLLKGVITQPFFLSNCDVLVDADYDCVYKTHIEQENRITLISAMKELEIPYGIVSTDPDGCVVEVKEKPHLSFLTNTGVYAIDPSVIESLDGRHVDITDIIRDYVQAGDRIGAFPITSGKWLDMGQIEEMKAMLVALGIDE